MGHYRPLKYIIIGLAKQKKGLIRRLRTVFFVVAKKNKRLPIKWQKLPIRRQKLPIRWQKLPIRWQNHQIDDGEDEKKRTNG